MQITRYLFALMFMGAAAAVAEEVFIDHQGLRLNALYENVDERPAVLMVHGTLAHNDMDILQGLREAVTESGMATLSINLSLGVDNRHGMYDCVVPHRHRHEDAVAEIAAWVDFLAKRGQEQIIVLAHSRGGNQLARYLAGDVAPQVKAGVLVAPMSWSYEGMQSAYRKRFSQALEPLLSAAESLVEEGKGDQMMDDTGFLYCAPGQVSAASFASYYRRDSAMHTANLYAAMKRPLLVVEGSEDRVSESVGEAFNNAEKGEQQTLVTIQGADHFFRDLYAYEVVDAISEFYAAISGSD